MSESLVETAGQKVLKSAWKASERAGKIDGFI
jgi:hypothetical protein